MAENTILPSFLPCSDQASEQPPGFLASKYASPAEDKKISIFFKKPVFLSEGYTCYSQEITEEFFNSEPN